MPGCQDIGEGRRLRDFIEVASDWLWETDAELRLVWLSDAFYAQTGLEPAAVLGRPCYTLNLLGPDSPEYCAHLADLEARRPFRGHRFELRDGHGALRILETSGRPVFDDEGRFVGYRGSAVDVTARVMLERALIESEERFRTLITNMRGIVFYRGEAGRGPLGYRHGITMYGEDACEIAGRTGDGGHTVVERWYAAVHPDDRATYLELERRRKELDEPYAFDYRIFHPATGELRWMREVAWVSRSAHTGCRYYDGYVLDITSQKRTELALKASERRWRTLVDAAPVAILVVEDGHVTLANRAAASLLGADTPEQLTGSALERFRVSPEPEEGTAVDMQQGVQVWQRLDGRRIICQVGIAPVDEEGDGEARQQFVLVDLTARIEAEKRAHFLAYHDPLTRLANRASLGIRLAHAIALSARRRSRLALHIIDLDGFKEVNDSFGHAAGDELLRQVAARFVEVVRASDILARLGGDEFAVVQVDLHDADDAASLARRLLGCFAEPFLVEGQAVHAGASIGVALYPDDASDPETLMRKADLAMYRAKGAGRQDFAFFVPALDRVLQLRRAMGAELRTALEQDAFFLVFQPRIDMANGCVAGAEALLRWRRPGQAAVGPDRFIPVAESSGLIRPLGRRVLELACRQLDTWQRAGLALPVAVNVSAAQLRDGDFVPHIEHLLATYAIEPRLLELEITEKLLVGPALEHVNRPLQRLAGLGVSITVDDFGTGCSSLLNLKGMPVGAIKIDRSFVAGIGSDRESESIVEAIIHLARSLGKKVVAEGVEHACQVRFLAERGCRFAQGFFYARPLEAAAFQELVSGAGPAAVVAGPR